MLVHGFTLSSRAWYFQVEHLRQEEGLRILVPDLRGHGGSTTGQELSVDATARDLCSIIRECAPRGRLVLAGHSLGVMTILAALRSMPSEDRERIAGIALVNGAINTFASAGITSVLKSLPVKAMRWTGKQVPDRYRRLKRATDALVAPIIAMFVYHGALEQGESNDYDIVGYHTQEIIDTSMGTILGFLDDLVNHDETAAAPYLHGFPGVVMVGVDDNVTPASQTRAIAQVWGAAGRAECPNAGHMLPVECPEKVNRELRRLVKAASSR